MGYFLGRGCVYIGQRNGAEILAVTQFHTNEFEISTEFEYAEHMNSCGAVKTRDVRVKTQSIASARVQIDEDAAEIIANAVGGSATADAGTAFTDLPLPDGLSTGDIIPVPKGYCDLSTLTIEDDVDAALALTTNYTVDMASGLITLVDLTGFTQPLKATGQTNAGTDVSIANNSGAVERFIRFVGKNIAVDPHADTIIDLYRGSIEPTTLPVKTEGDEFRTVDFEIPLLEDANAPLDAALGKYGKYRM